MSNYKFNIGDRVRITANTNDSCNKVGDIGVVKSRDRKTDHAIYSVYVKGRLSSGNYTLENEMELASKFKVGDIVVGTKKASSTYTITKQGFIGKVLDTLDNDSISYKNGILLTEENDIRIIAYYVDTKSVNEDDSTYRVNSKAFVLYTPPAVKKTRKKVVDATPTIETVSVLGEFITTSFAATDAPSLQAVIQSNAKDYFNDIATIEATLKTTGVPYSRESIVAMLAKKEYAVPVEAIRKIYKLACSAWKRKLEVKFPELCKTVFKFSKKNLTLNTHFSYDPQTPLIASGGLTAPGYNSFESLYVHPDYRLEVIEKNNVQFLVFHKK